MVDIGDYIQAGSREKGVLDIGGYIQAGRGEKEWGAQRVCCM